MTRIHMVSAINCVRSCVEHHPQFSGLLTDDTGVLHIRNLLDQREKNFSLPSYTIWDSLEKQSRAGLMLRLKQAHVRFDPSCSTEEPSSSSPPKKQGVSFTEPDTRRRGRLESRDSPKKHHKGEDSGPPSEVSRRSRSSSSRSPNPSVTSSSSKKSSQMRA